MSGRTKEEGGRRGKREERIDERRKVGRGGGEKKVREDGKRKKYCRHFV